MSDLFQDAAAAQPADAYTARSIEVLEGLEPVRRRPGMYIGGTDERALHHLVAEILDNAMDEAVAGYAQVIDIDLAVDGSVCVRDNGRGIPIDPHPRFPDKSALEVILTTLHSGGKFGGDAYKVSGGLHGVGISVVNALSDSLRVEVARDRTLWAQDFCRGAPLGPLQKIGPAPNRRGTQVRFHPDAEIFGPRARFKPALLHRMARSKAYLFRGVRIRWSCAPELLPDDAGVPAEDVFHFPNGLGDYLGHALANRPLVGGRTFAGTANLPDDMGTVEWALCWPEDDEPFFNSYVNTIPTPEGGTHEAGLRNALTRGLRSFAEMSGNKKGAAALTAEDVVGGAAVMFSMFLRDPQFQGQTKEKLASQEATRLVEQALRDPFDHWLTGAPDSANLLLTHALERADERLRRRQAKETSRKTATKKLRLPGKLSDCTRSTRQGTELFLVEGDSAGGSAKQARDRQTQAVLPLRGKILNVASASLDKLRGNQELSDLAEALGCGTRGAFDLEHLRYDKVVIMTDADVDGAHIASLLMTFFFREMPALVSAGHLYLAMPPLYRLTQGGTSVYARDDAHKDQLMKTVFKTKGKVEISRFKGLGEMPPAQLRETTMAYATRQLLRVTVPGGKTEEDREDARETAKLVEELMGRKPELRFRFIQENARFAENLDI
ncbi:DNA topoisomerase IV subunit B [Rhodospirillum rubrum]|uniref:DNA topoisomerase 4 subunit B n=1 Tax=Rhodospirillum rubrum (strain ATCC 11170 / ATH 1.1.1 / DSM 467 / LMG 4362 / NCIMB 8255 / S1) TaxID=269796 RepID=Q2RQT8_RHORT|nr:DNA topoisomerase IV subunit B [Rhodospirillum rubrum]ABC23507.1 Gram negative topoisomerase IV, subunit B [Rhodospirillum rubrum ATCC 11170]AEO49246.1 DNA topoisomerase IV subunit B [Rhodospirillum rubrum F11]MBK5955179.1 DNA topoisomerase IV subunit B [Rhodospirillum rubrum]QXG79475.1 DNA topoisomerase IV subunit B [Rhodospirillum rubrum]HAP98893.1 DNA topoisomerase IV subunit B [Rhodospirillum rubrum]